MGALCGRPRTNNYDSSRPKSGFIETFPDRWDLFAYLDSTNRTLPDITPPTTEQIERYAAEHHMDLTDAEVETMAAVLPEVLGAYERPEEFDPSKPDVTYPERRDGGEPDPDDDPPTVKFVATLGAYLAEEYHSHYYAKAQRTSPPRTTTPWRTLTYWRCRRPHRRLTSGWTIRRTPSSSTAR